MDTCQSLQKNRWAKMLWGEQESTWSGEQCQFYFLFFFSLFLEFSSSNENSQEFCRIFQNCSFFPTKPFPFLCYINIKNFNYFVLSITSILFLNGTGLEIFHFSKNKFHVKKIGTTCLECSHVLDWLFFFS